MEKHVKHKKHVPANTKIDKYHDCFSKGNNTTTDNLSSRTWWREMNGRGTFTPGST